MLILKSYKFFEYFIALGALQDIAQAARAAFISCSISLSLLFVFIHIMMNLSNFTVVIESICVISGYMSLFPIYLHMIFNRDRFAMLSNDLNNTVNERIQMKQDDRLYTETEEKFTYFMKMVIYALAFTSVMNLTPLIWVAYLWCMGTYTLDSWFIVYKMWFPLKLDSTLNWFLIECTELIGSISAMMIIVTAISFFFGIIMYTEAILKDIKSLLSRIDVTSRSIETSAKLQMTKYCIEAINLHTRLLGYMELLADIMNFVIFTVVVPSVMCAGSALFIFQSSTGFPSFYDFHMPLVGIFLTTELLGIFFYCGQLLHGLLISFSERIYESEWYRHPHSIQLSALLMIQRTHRPFFISAYGMMRCNLQSYIGILRAIYSAVMVMRRLNQ